MNYAKAFVVLHATAAIMCALWGNAPGFAGFFAAMVTAMAFESASRKRDQWHSQARTFRDLWCERIKGGGR